MKHKNRFLSGAVFKKDITRYAPLWGIYAVMLLIYAYSCMVSTPQAGFGQKICESMNTMSAVNLCYGGLCAMALFSDLFRPRMCYALHALPIRRESWLLTHVVSGLLFCLVPNIYFAVVCSVFLQQQFYLALIWLAVVTLQYLFFFCLGIFGAVCAGNHLGMAAIYGILNFVSLLPALLTQRLYIPAIYGITVDTHWLSYVLPVKGFSDFAYVSGSYDAQGNWVWGGFVSGGWVFLACTLAIGIFLVVLSVLIYRKRPLERAGNFISYQWLMPVCLAVIALAVGIFLDLMTARLHRTQNFTFLFIGLLIGYFAGSMLLKRKLRVFGWKNLLGSAALLVAVALSIFLFRIDAFGILRYVPDAKAVEYVTVEEYPGYSRYGQSGFVLDSYDTQYDTLKPLVLHDETQIEQVCKLHRESVADLTDRDRQSDDQAVYLTYVLKNGQTVTRTCRVDMDSASGQWLKQYYSSWEYLFQWDDVNTYKSWLIYAHAIDLNNDGDWLTKGLALGPSGHNTRPPAHNYAVAPNTSYMYGLIDAIKADCDAGNMAQGYEYHADESTQYRLELIWQTVHDPASPWKLSGTTTLELRVYPCCENTVAYIEQLREKLEKEGSIFPPPAS